MALIEHPAGEETQWDWLELPDPPAAWGWGRQAHLLVEALSHSGRWRGVLAAAEDQPHLSASADRLADAAVDHGPDAWAMHSQPCPAPPAPAAIHRRGELGLHWLSLTPGGWISALAVLAVLSERTRCG